MAQQKIQEQKDLHELQHLVINYPNEATEMLLKINGVRGLYMRINNILYKQEEEFTQSDQERLARLCPAVTMLTSKKS